MPLDDAGARGDRPATVAALEAVQITPEVNRGRHFQAVRRILVETGEKPVGFGVRSVTLQIADVIRDDMVSQMLIRAVVAECPISERLGAAHKHAMIVDRVRMIDRKQ